MTRLQGGGGEGEGEEWRRTQREREKLIQAHLLVDVLPPLGQKDGGDSNAGKRK